MGLTGEHRTTSDPVPGSAERSCRASAGVPGKLVLSALLACSLSGIGPGRAIAASTSWADAVRGNLAAHGALDAGTEQRFASAPATSLATNGSGVVQAPAPRLVHPVTAWAHAVESQLALRAHRVADAGRSALAWSERGVASWYDSRGVGRHTSSGARFNPMQLTCAHPTLPLGTKVLVTSERTGRSVVVTVNDRGPFGGRIVDLSSAAAARIGMLGSGTASVTLQRATPDAIEVAEAADGDTSDQAIAATTLR